MGTVLKVALGILLAGVVMIVGCVALLGAGADEVQRESDESSITVEQYQSARTGQITRDELVERFGEPTDETEFSTEVEGLDEPVGSECIYYNRRGELASLFQFCFDINTGRLESKSSI
jgi:hypothetical protein